MKGYLDHRTSSVSHHCHHLGLKAELGDYLCQLCSNICTRVGTIELGAR